MDINATDDFDTSAFLWARYNGYETVVAELLKHDTLDTNVVNDQGHTALLSACREGHGSVIQTLLCHKNVDGNTTGPLGYTCLKWASLWDLPAILMELLQSPQINVFAKSKRGSIVAVPAD